jgi:hypothetical protein
MDAKVINFTKNEKLTYYLESDENLKCLIYLKVENDINILLFKSIFDVLSISYEDQHKLTFAISDDNSSYIDLFDSNDVVSLKTINKSKYNYIFVIPGDYSAYKNKSNCLKDWNRKVIGLTGAVFSPAKVNVSLSKNSEIIATDFDSTHSAYSNIKDEIEERGLELKDIYSIDDKDDISEVSDSLDLMSGYTKSVGISGNGYIPFTTEFSIKGSDSVEGKVYPQSSSVLKYVNKSASKKEDICYDIIGKGMVEYDFRVNVLSNEISIEISLGNFDIKSGISNLVIDSIKNNSLSNDKSDTLSTLIDSISTAKYYMGTVNKNLLLAYSILGIKNCIVLVDDDYKGDYFNNTTQIDISEYEESSVGNMLEDVYSLEV